MQLSFGEWPKLSIVPFYGVRRHKQVEIDECVLISRGFFTLRVHAANVQLSVVLSMQIKAIYEPHVGVIDAVAHRGKRCTPPE